MMSTLQISVRIDELCERLALPEDEMLEIVAHDIVSPLDPDSERWQFDPASVAVIARAVRLHRDLEIDWSGVALALDLLTEIEQLRRDNQRLRQRLERFEE